MASCLVPDFPAVMVALEHLKDLDKQLREDGAPFSPEASLHLVEITAALAGLEADRRAAHEHLEVETIENSKLRHQLSNTSDRMSQEIMADVAAARASNAEEMEQLREDLGEVSRRQEAAARRQEALMSQNEALHPERELVKAQHREVVAALNDQITLKYGLQAQLGHTLEQVEEMKARAAAVQQDKVTLRQNMALERQAFAAKKDNLSRETDRVEGRARQQKQVIRRIRAELDKVDDKKQEAHDRLSKLEVHVAQLESNVQRLTASRCQLEEQLEGETQKHRELGRQREMLKEELRELEEAFRAAVRSLEEEIATVEGKIEEGRASGLLCQDSLAQIYEIFKRQRDEENEVRAEHFHVSQELERSRLQLEERIASIVKHSKEIRELDKQIGELLEADTINKRVFERNQEEMCGNVDTEKRNIGHLEEEKRRLTGLLEEARRKQEEHVAEMASNIGCARRRYEELRREEAALQRRQPKSTDAELLASHVTQCEVEYRQTEAMYHQEMEQCTAEAESIARSNAEKQRELEEKQGVLKDVEAKWREEQSRNQRLKALSSELSRRRDHLQLSIQGLRERTSLELQPKEEMKAELEELRASYLVVLDKQASELRAVETSIYDSSVKLEQVSRENSRLHLCIRQMTEGAGRARENKGRYWQEVRQFEQDIKALFESIQEAWREDLSVTQDRQTRDGVLLMSMSAMLNHLKARRQQLGNVSSLLHQQMLDFSKRLGDQTTVGQQS